MRVAVALAVVTLAAIIFARTSVGAPLEMLVFSGEDDEMPGAPVIIVTKSELTYQREHVGIRCDVVVEKLKHAVAVVDPALAVIASTKSPIVLSSCIYEGWSEALKECIVMATAEQLAAHHCDALVSDDLAQKLIDRLAPGQHISPRDFLQR